MNRRLDLSGGLVVQLCSGMWYALSRDPVEEPPNVQQAVTALVQAFKKARRGRTVMIVQMPTTAVGHAHRQRVAQQRTFVASLQRSPSSHAPM